MTPAQSADGYAELRAALEAKQFTSEGTLAGPWFVCEEPRNDAWFKGQTIGALLGGRRICDVADCHEREMAALSRYIAAANPAVIAALLAERDELCVELVRRCRAIDRLNAEMDQLRRALDAFIALDPTFTKAGDKHLREMVAEGSRAAPMAQAVLLARAAMTKDQK